MKTLRRGSKGEDVERWQAFLRGAGYTIVVDGDFGTRTHDATVSFQRTQSLLPDGVVGNRTYAAAMAHGFALVEDDPPDLLPKPPFAPLGVVGRNRLFGTIAFESRPTALNPESVVIVNGWAERNIVHTALPLPGMPGLPAEMKVAVHRLAEKPLLALLQAWRDAGLIGHILAWGGLWVPRYVRGSKTTLSSHAHGTAFDINAAWNGLGKVPASWGTRGSVRELVPIANRLGWYWGGHFSRPDGMHFELTRPGADTDPAPPPEAA